MDVLIFDSHLFHWVRSKNGFHFCYNGALESEQDNLVFLLDGSINKKTVDSCPVALYHLDLHDRTLELIFLDLNPLRNAFVGEAVQNNHCQQVRNAFPSNTRGGNQRNKLIWLLILPVKCRIVTFFVQLEDHLL